MGNALDLAQSWAKMFAMIGEMWTILVLVGLVAMGGGYLWACRVLAAKQVALVYQPAVLHADHNDHVDVLDQGQGVVLRGWVDNPGHAQALVYYGGSSEQIELRRSTLAAVFPKHTRYFVPYRGFGPNHHWMPTEDILKKDAHDLLQRVASAHQFVDVIGRSLGTSMAAYACAHSGVRALALITPFSSVFDIAQARYAWAPVGLILRDRHEVWKDVSCLHLPILAYLAEHDSTTPHKFWAKLQRFFNTPVQVAMAKTEDHSSIAFCIEMWHNIAQFFAHPTPVMDRTLTASFEDHSDES